MADRLMKLVLTAAAAALLAACSGMPDAWRAETVSVLLEHPAPPRQHKAPPCPPLDPGIAAEAGRLTPIAGERGNFDAITAALLGSEARKNVKLQEAVTAYEQCRRRG